MNNGWIPSTQTVVNDGVNTNLTPDQIGSAQTAWSANATIRDGKLRTRSYKLVQRATMPKGLVQGAGYFSANNGQLVVSIWGQLYRILVNANNVTIDPIPLAFRNSALKLQAWMCETVGSFLIQDGQSDCIIYDGSSTRRADPSQKEVPLGRQMAYGNGRLCVAVNGNQVKVGNITTDIYQSELSFTETQYLNGGGSFLYPQNLTALAFLPVNNTFSGYGSLLDFGEQFIDSLHLEITQRDQWASKDGFGVVVLPNVGSCAQDVIVRVNQDLYFRDADGQIWSVRSAVSDQNTPGNSPLSREISRIVDFETDVWVPYSSGIYFDGRMMWLASPFMNRFGLPSFKAIISLDAAPLATMRGKTPPAYDGVADGLWFQRICAGKFSGQNRAFVISTDEDGENRLWEIVARGEADQYFKTEDDVIVVRDSLVTANTETRRYDFGAPPLLKQLMRLDLWPAEIEGENTVQVYYRADNRTKWQFWSEFSCCARMTNADDQWLNLYNQERGRVISLSSPYVNDDIDNQQANVGFGFQIRVVWTGKLLFDRITAWARPLPETAYSNIPDLEIECIRNNVANNEIIYSIPIGGLGATYTDQDDSVYVDSFGVPYTQQIS